MFDLKERGVFLKIKKKIIDDDDDNDGDDDETSKCIR